VSSAQPTWPLPHVSSPTSGPARIRRATRAGAAARRGAATQHSRGDQSAFRCRDWHMPWNALLHQRTAFRPAKASRQGQATSFGMRAREQSGGVQVLARHALDATRSSQERATRPQTRAAAKGCSHRHAGVQLLCTDKTPTLSRLLLWTQRGRECTVIAKWGCWIALRATSHAEIARSNPKSSYRGTKLRVYSCRPSPISRLHKGPHPSARECLRSWSAGSSRCSESYSS